MKNWKSLLALVMALVMAFGILAGCDTAAPPEDTKPGSTATASCVMPPHSHDGQE